VGGEGGGEGVKEEVGEGGEMTHCMQIGIKLKNFLKNLKK
jgi:hypothetical protein